MCETREVYVGPPPPRDTTADQHFNATGAAFQIPQVVVRVSLLSARGAFPAF